MFGLIVPIGVKTLSYTNLVASKRVKMEMISVPVDVLRSKTIAASHS